jgi:hypothetical protein
MAALLLIGIIIWAGSYQLYISAFATTQPTQLSLNQMYTNAIEDAMVTKQSEVYNSLTAITENNSNLIWQGDPGNQSLLVVTWTKYASSYPVGETVNTTWGYTWVTAAPQIQTFFKDHVNPDTNATLRAAELLGLPPNTTDTVFVELWVKPQSLFRPTPDNEINDTVAQLTFPASATAGYKQWFNNNIIASYYPMNEPWTRLGYTYDWGNTKNHVGLSEFVLWPNSTVTVKSVTPTAQYLNSTQ